MRAAKISLLVLLALSVAGLGYDAATLPGHNGPVTERFDGTRFRSASFEKKQPADLLRWQLNRDQGPWEQRPTRQADSVVKQETDALRITLINHATLLIQTRGLNLLTDPIWSPSSGPFGRLGPSRFREPGIAFDDLPPIDAVFVSHSHYDHMDLPTLERLDEAHSPLFVVGLGNAGNLAKVDIEKVTELDWWQSVELADDVTLTMTPAEHWSKRTVLDTNRTLWGSFVLEADDDALLFFAGDTGAGEHFEQIHQRFGPVEFALMPIGAYLPRWFMRDNHLSPAEALVAAQTLRSDVMIPMHFGTFALGDDGQDEPLVDLLAAYSPGTGKAASASPESEATRSAARVSDASHRVQLRVLDNGQSARFNR